MAKCVKNKKTGKVRRVSDEEADRMVSGGNHKFCPKSEYKKQKRREASK